MYVCMYVCMYACIVKCDNGQTSKTLSSIIESSVKTRRFPAVNPWPIQATPAVSQRSARELCKAARTYLAGFKLRLHCQQSTLSQLSYLRKNAFEVHANRSMSISGFDTVMLSVPKHRIPPIPKSDSNSHVGMRYATCCRSSSQVFARS